MGGTFLAERGMTRCPAPAWLEEISWRYVARISPDVGNAIVLTRFPVLPLDCRSVLAGDSANSLRLHCRLRRAFCPCRVIDPSPVGQPPRISASGASRRLVTGGVTGHSNQHW